MLYKSAADIAIEIGYQLMPHCEKLNIAGSIRRKKPQVKDIELVCIPRCIAPTDLFGNVIGKPEPIPAFVELVKSLGVPVRGQPTGKYTQITLHQGIALDLFMPDSFDYYRTYAIRTGSADYSAKVIAGGWKAKGWCGSDKGLRLIADCQNRATGGKMDWICINPNAEKPPVWESEQEFFDWLGVQWIKPELRNL
ncbi:hypothetical protein GCM10028808_73470 [Spirosoma migulaei]